MFDNSRKEGIMGVSYGETVFVFLYAGTQSHNYIIMRKPRPPRKLLSRRKPMEFPERARRA